MTVRELIVRLLELDEKHDILDLPVLVHIKDGSVSHVEVYCVDTVDGGKAVHFDAPENDSQ